MYSCTTCNIDINEFKDYSHKNISLFVDRRFENFDSLIKEYFTNTRGIFFFPNTMS